MKMPGFNAEASLYGKFSRHRGLSSAFAGSPQSLSGQVVMSMPMGGYGHPCDRACECCGQWNVPACCDYCWRCWFEGP